MVKTIVAPIPAEPWLAHLLEHVAIARAGNDAEGVHQVRVASGRLDVWLRMGERRVLRDDLHWLRSAASDVRDFDVLLERSLPTEFSSWVEAERERARAKLLHVLDDQRSAALVHALGLLSGVEQGQALAYVERESRKVLERGRAVERDDATIADMHRLRRAARRLRYAREAVGLGTRRIKSIQDELGRLNDAAVALAHLDHCPHALELAEFRARLGEEVQQAFEDARAAWRDADLPRAED